MNDVEAVLLRPDRLTPGEAHATVVQTLEAVHGLVQNMKLVMDGETRVSYFVTHLHPSVIYPFRCQSHIV